MHLDKLIICPIGLSEANEFVTQNHRHHKAVRGCKFCIGIRDAKNVLRGVIIAGRPISRVMDDGHTLEVTRCCTDGVRNGCSMLYSATSRAAKAMGYRQLITYTLTTESGSSLRGAGWRLERETKGGSWNRPRRRRDDNHPTCKKKLWVDPSISTI